MKFVLRGLLVNFVSEELFVDDSEEKLFVDLRYCLSQFNLRMHCAKILNGQQS